MVPGAVDDGVARALAVNEAYAALGNERFEAEGATFVRNHDTPDIWDANHVANVTAATPQAIERLLARAEREYAHCGHRRFDIDYRTPPEFEARLALEGYIRSELLVMLLEGEPAGAAPAHDIRPLEGEEVWRAYTALHDIDWREYAERIPGSFDERSAEQMVRSRREKSPPASYWLAYVDGEPAAYVASWPGTDGVGIVEDLFTHPDYRRRGLATALVQRGVAHCRANGAGPVVIVADPDDTPKRMYAAMGFRPVAVKRNYLKRLGET